MKLPFLRRFATAIFTAFIIAESPWLTSYAEAETTPPRCDGFNPDTKSWGMLELEPKTPQLECPKGMAIVFHSPLTNGVHPPETRPLIGSCCPLLPGALLEKHSYHPAACPKGSVVTGGRLLKMEEISKGKFQGSYELRCTEIDLQKFQLDEVTQPLALEFGTDDIFTYFRSDSKIEARTGRNHLPLWLVEGVGRTSRSTWTASGCIGFPWGSAMTKMGSAGCNDFEYQQVIEKPTESQASSDSSTKR